MHSVLGPVRNPETSENDFDPEVATARLRSLAQAFLAPGESLDSICAPEIHSDRLTPAEKNAILDRTEQNYADRLRTRGELLPQHPDYDTRYLS